MPFSVRSKWPRRPTPTTAWAKRTISGDRAHRAGTSLAPQIIPVRKFYAYFGRKRNDYNIRVIFNLYPTQFWDLLKRAMYQLSSDKKLSELDNKINQFLKQTKHKRSSERANVIGLHVVKIIWQNLGRCCSREAFRVPGVA